MKSLIILLLLPISLFSQKKITKEEFKELIIKGNALVIDVRTPVEFSEAHIKNAINIDYFSKSFEATISKLDKKKTILVYCAAGGRSTSACLDFKKLGFKKVYNLYGGILHWVNQGRPVFANGKPTLQVHTYSKPWSIWLTKGEKVY